MKKILSRIFGKKKLNNIGMTLVEVLVAMSIVSIAVVPLLHAFVKVTQFSMKGRMLQQTSTVAQTVMENCKAFNVDDIQKMMLGVTENGIVYGPFLKGDYAQYCEYGYDINETTVVTEELDEKGNLVEKDHILEVQDYYINNIQLDNQKYGIKFTLTPIFQAKKPIMQSEKMNPKLDAVFREESAVVDPVSQQKTMKYYEEMFFEDVAMGHIAKEIQTQSGYTVNFTNIELFNNFYNKEEYDPNYQKCKIHRTITINASNKTITGGVADVATVTYTYRLEAGSYDFNGITYTWPGMEIDYTVSIYDNSKHASAGTKLENVYLFYYPAYKKNVVLFYESDNIMIENQLKDGENPRELNVYLSKQIRENMITDDAKVKESLRQSELDYDVKLNHDGNRVNIYHNFETNLGDMSYDTTGWANSEDVNVHVKVWNGTAEDDEYKVKLFDSLVREEEEELMYRINLTVYRNPEYTVTEIPGTTNFIYSMTGEEVLHLDGTKIDW